MMILTLALLISLNGVAAEAAEKNVAIKEPLSLRLKHKILGSRAPKRTKRTMQQIEEADAHGRERRENARQATEEFKKKNPGKEPRSMFELTPAHIPDENKGKYLPSEKQKHLDELKDAGKLP